MQRNDVETWQKTFVGAGLPAPTPEFVQWLEYRHVVDPWAAATVITGWSLYEGHHPHEGAAKSLAEERMAEEVVIAPYWWAVFVGVLVVMGFWLTGGLRLALVVGVVLAAIFGVGRWGWRKVEDRW